MLDWRPVTDEARFGRPSHGITTFTGLPGASMSTRRIELNHVLAFWPWPSSPSSLPALPGPRAGGAEKAAVMAYLAAKWDLE